MLNPEWSDEKIEEYLRTLACWQGDITVEPLVGGLCNKSFTVTDSERKAVARIGMDIPVHGIMQTSVQASMLAAADIGVSPKVHYTEESLVILDFLPGGSLRPEDMENNAANCEKIVKVLKRLHEGSDHVRGALTYFWPFQVIRNYVEIGTRKDSRLIEEFPELIRINNLIEQSVQPYLPVLTHNDAVPQNFMFGESKEIWLIDWDYGGYGHPMFDLVGVSCNADMSEGSERELFEMYYGPLDEALDRQLTAFKLVLNLREYMWGMVQEVTSELDSDNVAASMTDLYPDQEAGYEGYTNMNRDRFESNWKRYRHVFE